MENKDIKEVEKGILDLLSGKPLEFDLELQKPTLIQKIFRKTKRHYSIVPLNLNDTVKIANLLNQCEDAFTELDNTTILDRERILSEYSEQFFEIIGTFLNENNDFVGNQININDAIKLIYKVIETKQTAFFLNTLASLNNTMKVKPTKK